MGSHLDLSASQLLALLDKNTGIDRDQLLALAGVQPLSSESKSTYSSPEAKDLHKPKVEGPPEEARANESSDAPAAYWKLVKVSKSNAHVPATVELTAGASAKSAPELQVVDFATSPLLCSPSALREKLEAISVNKAGDRTLIEQYWYRCLSTAQTPMRHFQPTAVDNNVSEWVVVCDYSMHLMQWWDDIRALPNVMAGLYGKANVRRVPVRVVGGEVNLTSEKHPLPDIGRNTRLLVASDCGAVHGRHAIRQAWETQLGEWIHCGIDVVVLSPDGNTQSAANLSCEQVPWGDHWVLSEPELNTRLQNLLACLSTVQWCSWALLRYWRRSLGLPAGAEQLVRHHPHVWAEPAGCLIDNQIEQYRSRFTGFKLEDQQRLLAPANQLRSGVASWVVKEEALVRESLGIKTEGAATAIITGLSGRSLSHEEKAWLYDLSQRQDKRFWERFPDLRELCIAAGRELYGEDVKIPDSLAGEAKKHEVSELQMVAAPDGISVGHNVSGNILATLEVAESFSLTNESDNIKASVNDMVTVDGESVSLSSDSAQLELMRAVKPDWAVRIEQTNDGLHATLEDNRRLRWCSSGGRYEDFLQGAAGAWVDTNQIFKDFPNYLSSQHKSVLSNDGFDLSRLRIRLDLADAPEFQMRWIPPGEFTMGSPEHELGRYDDEVQHQVIISQGFWMMDTTCPQRLWKAMTGENPSHFEGPNLPVENVSWEDIIEKFLPSLNELVPGINFRLPTEAQWEYACRAGSRTAFNFGDRVSFDQARFLGHLEEVRWALENDTVSNQVADRYGEAARDADWAEWLMVPVEAVKAARAGDESYFNPREGTIDVHSLAPNRWGLHQMHGNVWEWCQDSLEEDLKPYSGASRVDPVLTGPGRRRGFRGGSWYNGGRDLRSAMRNHDEADDRDGTLGFRLVAGPQASGAPEAAAAAGSADNEAERNGRRTGSSGGER